MTKFTQWLLLVALPLLSLAGNARAQDVGTVLSVSQIEKRGEPRTFSYQLLNIGSKPIVAWSVRFVFHYSDGTTAARARTSDRCLGIGIPGAGGLLAGQPLEQTYLYPRREGAEIVRIEVTPVAAVLQDLSELGESGALERIFKERKHDEERWNAIVVALEKSRGEGGLAALKARQKEMEAAAESKLEGDNSVVSSAAKALGDIVRKVEESNSPNEALTQILEVHRHQLENLRKQSQRKAVSGGGWG